MMQPIAGGAVARPFVTHHNALDVDLYLRIAPELYLKRLVVGGFERVYEINRNFRNEGISSLHNPEFTMLEFYTAYFDCRDVIAITEELVTAAARVAGEGPLSYRGREVSFRAPFRRVGMMEAVAQVAAEQGWGIGADEIADARGARGLAARGRARGERGARLEGRGRVPRRGLVAAAAGAWATASGSPTCSRSGSRALGPGEDAAVGADVRDRPPARDLAARQGAPRPARASRTASSSTPPAWRSPTASPS